MDNNIKTLKEVIEEVLSNNWLHKSIFTFKEGCMYCDISPSEMYKKTSGKSIPHYKPEGKKIYFKKDDLDEWLLRNKQSTNDELENQASKYSLTHKKY